MQFVRTGTEAILVLSVQAPGVQGAPTQSMPEPLPFLCVPASSSVNF